MENRCPYCKIQFVKADGYNATNAGRHQKDILQFFPNIAHTEINEIDTASNSADIVEEIQAIPAQDNIIAELHSNPSTCEAAKSTTGDNVQCDVESSISNQSAFEQNIPPIIDVDKILPANNHVQLNKASASTQTSTILCRGYIPATLKGPVLMTYPFQMFFLRPTEQILFSWIFLLLELKILCFIKKDC